MQIIRYFSCGAHFAITTLICDLSDLGISTEGVSKKRTKSLKMQKNAEKTQKYRVRACTYEIFFVILCDFL